MSKLNRIHTSKNVYFVRTRGELIETLFQPGRTASGLFRKHKRNVLFYGGNGELFAILDSTRGEPRFISSHKVSSGATFKYTDLRAEDRQRLGIMDMSLFEVRRVISDILDQL